MAFKRGGEVAQTLGVSTAYLKKCAREGRFPEGSVMSTPGGHYLYDVEMIRDFFTDTFKQQTKYSRLEAGN